MHSQWKQIIIIMNQKYFIGIDISKEKIDVAIVLGDFSILAERVVKNEPSKIESFLKAFCRKYKSDHSDLLVCCENTGIYNRPLEKICDRLGIALWVEHAVKIKRASIDMRGKTDRKDALRIAEYSVRYQDRKVLYKEPSGRIAAIKANQKVRETIITNRVAIENQMREAKSHDPELHKQLTKAYSPIIKALNKQLHRCKKEIESLIEEEPQLKKNVQLMKTIPGIGMQNATQMVIETDNFNRFQSAKHLACYAGVVPFANESGTMVRRQRISKMANQKMKSNLHLGAMAAVRADPELKEYFKRKVAEGKNKMSVINAVRRKLVDRIWAVIQRQTPYELETKTILSK